ncbi:MAG: amidohydrolase [Chitinophagaceae bacterium]|nr:amidohydrolase [Chitinophagaceae bacterium]
MSTLSFTLVQTALHWEDAAANRKMFEEKLNQLSPTEIVVLPETFSTGFSMNPSTLAETMQGETVQWMKSMAEKHKIILTGSLIIKENEHYHNRLIWMLPNGQCGHYDKRHLFSYAGEDVAFTPGEKRLITQVKGWKICTLICYDLRFPVWSRQHTDGEYDVLLYMANWPERRIAAWNSLLRARAIENQCYVVAVNRIGEDGNGHQYPGDSCVIDPMGEIIYQNRGGEDMKTISLNKEELIKVRTQFPFQKDKDDFMIL